MAKNTALKTSVGSGASYPTSLTSKVVQTQPPAIAGAELIQVLGVSSSVASVNVPGIAAGSSTSVTARISLSGFPDSFTLQKGAKGLVCANVFIGSSVKPNTVVGLPATSLFFGSGQQTSPGSTVWALSPGTRYQGASLFVTVTVTNWSPSVYLSAQSITLVAQGVLYVTPSSSVQ